MCGVRTKLTGKLGKVALKSRLNGEKHNLINKPFISFDKICNESNDDKMQQYFAILTKHKNHATNSKKEYLAKKNL